MVVGDEISQICKDGKYRKWVYVQCGYCARIFPKQKRSIKQHEDRKCIRFYCDKECQGLDKTTKSPVNCGLCKREFVITPSKKLETNFCSKRCMAQAMSLKIGLIKNSNYKVGKYIYRERAFEHFFHMCEWCGDDFYPVLHVHHINHDRSDNDLWNLMILCCNCHELETRGSVKIVNRKPVLLNEALRSDMSKRFDVVLG